ncbi:MmcQ/YjbR family DNA-binding protein [Actinosynnema sp. NPDC050436]|uniref:MmcQ/YjbR family DNA-binding protein n=1 Tax=Actinosynnema sp. NPDC050436 TaxID=3155659 RepID=UPI0033C57DA7
MATWDDVRRPATALPDVTERPSHGGLTAWRVGDWLGASVPDPGVKEALPADDPDVCFTTPHFDGYAAVLVRLDRIGEGERAELETEAWLCKAPKRVAEQFGEGRPGG